MNKIREVIKTYFSTKQKAKVIGTLALTMIFLGVILSQIVSFASLEPIRSITITSENLSYENNEPGSWQITKSAKWTSKGKAQITFELDTLVKTNNIDTDVILVLDTSGSMSGERIDKVKADTTSLIADILSNENNNVSLITFSTTSEIINDFTKDTTALIDSINNLEALGNTNYYQALVNVDKILKNYTWEENKDCVVLFLTDGYPNVNSPNEIAEYNYLKTTYPYLTINSIQYEMGEEQLDVLKEISDNQYNANIDNLETYLYRASVSPLPYENFEIIDYINNDKFTIIDESLIKTKTGTYTLEDNKITWNIGKINSGSSHSMTIDIDLKEGISGIGEVFPTNEITEVISLMERNEEIVSTERTPVLADTYKIIYEENTPDNCSVLNMPASTTASIFDTVKITSQEPTCNGYKFKEWNIVTTNIKKINDNSFTMPEEDVTIRATWIRLSSTKSMDGKISKVQTLYQMMADNSVPDNIKSEFVKSETGIDFSKISSNTNGKGIYELSNTSSDEYPIYYYRGAVENNNLIFANFCWKIVRTTSTGGVKLIYNGMPNEDGSCTATGADSQIGTSAFNSNTNSIAYSGYMYGNAYLIQSMTASISGLGGKTHLAVGNMNTTNYIYSSSVSYDEETGIYTLIDGENRVWNDTYSVENGNQFLYTCFSETESSCTTIKYIVKSNESNATSYINFSNGEIAEDTLNRNIVYGNDVTYDEATGTYTLQDTITKTIGEWNESVSIISGTENPGYHYTCFTEESSCNTINYMNYIEETPERSIGTIYYIQISNGKKIDEVVNEMTIESENTTSSTIKTEIDNWYETNMLSYGEYIEDTPYCNDRTLSSLGAWDKDTDLSNNLVYKTQSDYFMNELSITCRNKNDAFTVNDTTNGNGKLKYPIGLLTGDEVIYAGTKVSYGINTDYYLFTGNHWWTMSPSSATKATIYVFDINTSGWLFSNGNYVKLKYGVRPSISLKPETKSIDGDGSPEDPFIVE